MRPGGKHDEGPHGRDIINIDDPAPRARRAASRQREATRPECWAPTNSSNEDRQQQGAGPASSLAPSPEEVPVEAHPDDLAVLLSRFPAAGPPRLADAGRVVAFLRICRALEPGLVWPADQGATRATWIEDVATLEFRLRPWESRMVGLQQEGVEPHFGMPMDHDLVERDMELLLGIPRGVAERLAETASRCWRGAGKEAVRRLEFVRDPDMRRIAERDLRSLAALRRVEETKSALTLAGAVIEAVLTDLLEQDQAKFEAARKRVNDAGRKRKVEGPPGKLHLHELIDVAGPGGLGRLSERTRDAAHFLRDSRNFVHPGVERSATKGELLQTHEAALAEALVEMVLAELNPRNP